MKKLTGLIFGLVVVVVLMGKALAVQQNLDSHGIGDSAATASTFVFRDSSGNFAANAITSNITAVAQTVAVSSNATANLPFVLDGMYTSLQLAAKTPTAAGQLVYNITLNLVCVSTGASIQGYSRVTGVTTCQ